MKTVQPIKDKKLINDICEYLKNKSSRDYMLFYIGINSGLRISDLINLKTYQVRNKDFINITEKKTGKEKLFPIFPHVKAELEKYLLEIKNNLYLFQTKYGIKNICRHRAYQILKDVQREFKLDLIGTHTLRKTFGYHYYLDVKELATLMLIFNHSSETTTLRYIGMSQERINNSLMKWGGIK